MAVNTTQGIVLAIFGANAGGHLTSLDANATANGNASLATDLSAAAGLILGVDLSTDAAFTSTVLGNLGIAEDSAGYTLASNYFTTNLAAGAGRGDLVAAAVEYLLGSNVDASLTDTATAFSASVTAGVEYSQGEGASVFGVAQLQTAAGSAATAGQGSTFTLTSDEDTMNGTAGNDTFEGTTANLSADDRITDGTSADNDTFNLTATGDPAAMDVTNVENININWDAFGTPDIDLDNVVGATVTVSSSKTGYVGNLNVTNAGSNSVVAGAGVVGDVDVAGLEDASVTGQAADKITVTGADGLITVNAGTATEVTVSGADDVVIVANSADTVVVQDAFDTANITLGTSGDLTIDGASDAIVTLTNSTDTSISLDVTAQGGNDFEEIVIGEGGAIKLDFADDLDVDGKTIVNGGEIVVAAALDTAADLDAVTHTNIILETALPGSGTVTLAKDAYVTLEAAAAGTTDFVLASSKDGSSDALTLVSEVSQTATLNTAAATNTDFEELTIVADGSADMTFTKVNAGTGTVNVESASYDVTFTSLTAETVNLNAVALEGTVTQGSDANMTVVGADGDYTVTFASTTNESTFNAGDGDNSIVFATTTGTAAALVGAGELTVAADDLTTGDLIVIAGGSSDVSLDADALTTGSVNATLGNGDNTVTIGAGATAASFEFVATAGDGDDELIFEGTKFTSDASTESITFDMGTGNNTMTFAGTTTYDLTDATLNITGLDVIDLGGNATTTTFDAAFLTGQSYEIKGAGNTLATDLLNVHTDTAGTYDFSDLDMNLTAGDNIDGLNISGAGSKVINVTGSDLNDTIDIEDGGSTVNGGAGADSITLGDGDDTVILGARSELMTTTFAGGQTTASDIDRIVRIEHDEDVIVFSSAEDAYGDFTLTSDTSIVVQAVSVATAHDFDALFAAVEGDTSINTDASSASSLNVFVATVGSGTLANESYIIINDNNATITSTDTIIAVGTISGGSLDAGDFSIA